MSVNMLMSLVIMALLATVLGGWLMHFKASAQGYADSEQCKGAAQLAIAYDPIGGITVKNPNPQAQFTGQTASLCPVNKITFSKNFKEDYARKVIASEIASCYDKYLRGKVNLFDSKTGQNIYCSMCDFIDMSKAGKDVNGITDYMNNNDIPGLGITYSDYLYSDKSSTQDGSNAPSVSLDTYKSSSGYNQDLTLQAGKNYAIYFIYVKDAHFFQNPIFKDLTKVSAGTGGGLAVSIGLVAAGVAGSWIIVPSTILGAIVAGSINWKSPPPNYEGNVLVTEYTTANIQKFGCSEYSAQRPQ